MRLDLATNLRTALGCGLSPAEGLRAFADGQRSTFFVPSGLLTFLELGRRQRVRYGPAAAAAEDGAPLSEALRSSRLIDDWEARLLATGERAGRLEDAIETWIDALRVRAGTARVIPHVLFYPMVLAVVAAFQVGMLSWKVLPTMAGLFTGVGAELPRASQWAARSASWSLWIGLAALILALLWFALELLARTRWGVLSRGSDRLLFSLPFSSGARRALARSVGLQAMATALDAGDSEREALQAASDCQASAGGTRAWRRLSEVLERGGSPVGFGLLGAGFSRVLRTALAGDDSAERLRRLARRELSSWWRRFESMLAWLEPALVLGLGVFLGTQVVGWWLMIYSLNWMVIP